MVRDVPEDDSKPDTPILSGPDTPISSKPSHRSSISVNIVLKTSTSQPEPVDELEDDASDERDSEVGEPPPRLHSTAEELCEPEEPKTALVLRPCKEQSPDRVLTDPTGLKNPALGLMASSGRFSSDPLASQLALPPTPSAQSSEDSGQFKIGHRVDALFSPTKDPNDWRPAVVKGWQKRQSLPLKDANANDAAERGFPATPTNQTPGRYQIQFDCSQTSTVFRTPLRVRPTQEVLDVGDCIRVEMMLRTKTGSAIPVGATGFISDVDAEGDAQVMFEAVQYVSSAHTETIKLNLLQANCCRVSEMDRTTNDFSNLTRSVGHTTCL